MIGELALRFVLGGIIVSFFAVVGELWKPKTFAGLFGAAPSVAIGTLGIAYFKNGPSYVAFEGRSMLVGAGAFLVYTTACIATLRWKSMPVWLGAALAWIAWAVAAFAMWKVLLDGALE